MKHDVKELYVLTNMSSGKSVYCTLEYLNFNGLEPTPKGSRKTVKILVTPKMGGFNGATSARIYDVEGARTIYPYGSYYWFDTENERDLFKTEAQAERANFLAWNKIKKDIIAKLDGKSKEELEAILASL